MKYKPIAITPRSGIRLTSRMGKRWEKVVLIATGTSEEVRLLPALP